MVIALYGNVIDSEHSQGVKLLLDELAKRSTEVIIYAPFYDALVKQLGYTPTVRALYRTPGEVKYLANFMISIGGDGTFLESVSYIEESCVPVVGINFGRLGFLANISSEEISAAVDQLFRKDYTIKKRSALEISMNDNPFDKFPYGLNDLSLQKKGTAMITINAFINDDFLCTYWADGLIVSTPTGSTAYSLSVGGPIVSPDTNAFVISPIAPHNLTVRPLVIPDSSTIRLEASSRDKEILISLDSRSVSIGNNISISIRKAPFCVGIVSLTGNNYFRTLRNKLMWGADTRNNGN
ncbi:MAG: NAD kinase [Tenuifilaceae bacterium]|jgi:NAD+ kinase|nr:NAD kinase [Tenuifilaceae bacterium]